MFKIAVLISGGGTNLQAIIDSIKNNELECSIEYVISDNKNAGGLLRAERENIKTVVFDRKEYSREEISNNVIETIHGKVDLVVLAGFLTILRGDIIKKFNNKIINLHPSLIPNFCGKGMYGDRVHKAVLESGVEKSGCTMHFVDEGTDTGPIIQQAEVKVEKDDTIESLRAKVNREEHKLIVKVIKQLIEDNQE
ncbi:phosphoribosylglycinamide formyltransferase [Oceanirhabdus sp. W0125-5]|uniref:phosphoribosylglycinamide formyltransferase n=1 Tax=Oceanirhabdus sp. W0125-5 TaxID=2999116 RepID=UPI0022F31E91|nr:phosphoribosylglycinamide formyltransferase [Oceanirhabdus sp. W0125-5]WBW95727.1 phosphoribosylglycinamide formyltransferase [Oceanirhabdus sp. W0125-5]